MALAAGVAVAWRIGWQILLLHESVVGRSVGEWPHSPTARVQRVYTAFERTIEKTFGCRVDAIPDATSVRGASRMPTNSSERLEIAFYPVGPPRSGSVPDLSVELINLPAITLLDRPAAQLESWGKSTVVCAELIGHEQNLLQCFVAGQPAVYFANDVFIERPHLGMADQRFPGRK